MSELDRLSLKHGDLTFSALSAGEGPLVFCLHGFPDTPETFSSQLRALADAGFHGVAPWMRGYEPGSQPGSHDYAIESLAADVFAWADDLGATRFHIVGHDWGAVVGYVAAGISTGRVASLVTMAVPHTAGFSRGIARVPGQLLKSWYMNFFQLRGIAEAIVARDDWALIRKLWRDWSPGYTLTEAEWRDLVQTFAQPGVKAAMLAYYRANATPLKLLGLQASAMTDHALIEVPTLAFTGADDGCIDTRMYDFCFDTDNFPAGLEIQRIADAGHFLTREAAEEINPIMIDWLLQHNVDQAS